ncbi:MAG: ribosome maturation factor RimM [Clostridia bacterium]|nr:ribosome maturation factor RimM [Clostridia bacterium]
MPQIEIGKIVNTHGLKGEVKVEPWCDGIETFEYLKRVFVNNIEYSMGSVKLQKNLFLVKLKELTTVEDAELLKGKIIYANEDEMPPLPEGVYYLKDIVGLLVYEGDKFIGEITDWIETGANNVYIIKRPKGKDLLIPAIDSVIKEIDIENKKMSVTLLEGLMNDED